MKIGSRSGLAGNCFTQLEKEVNALTGGEDTAAPDDPTKEEKQRDEDERNPE